MNERHKELQILKVPDIIEYKLSKLIHSLLKDSHRLPEVLHKLIIPTESIHIATQEISIKFIVRERKNRSENDNLSAIHHKTGIITQNI